MEQPYKRWQGLFAERPWRSNRSVRIRARTWDRYQTVHDVYQPQGLGKRHSGLQLRPRFWSLLQIHSSNNRFFEHKHGLAETETDLRQVNLTRYPLFFPEKRDFLQDSNVFSFEPKSIQPFFSESWLDAEGNPISIKATELSGRVGRFTLDDQPGIDQKYGSSPRIDGCRSRIECWLYRNPWRSHKYWGNSLLGVDANIHNTSLGSRGMNYSTNVYAIGSYDTGQVEPSDCIRLMVNLNDDVHYTYAGLPDR